MSDYGVTEKGFVLKRLDTIMEEVHSDLTEGFGFDTRLQNASFLDVLVTSFCGKMADLWETAQNSYYAKYPATATGLNLDHAVQFGGISRAAQRRTCYPLHCTGDDGTVIREDVLVATDTKPEIQLYAAQQSVITRDAFNKVQIKVPVVEADSVYTVTINGDQYSYLSADADEESILAGLQSAITDSNYVIEVKSTDDGRVLLVEDTEVARSNVLVLSDNLTTQSVTSIVNFFTVDYGKITLPNSIVSKMVTNVTGFDAVTNMLEPVYGRLNETDVELRQSYANKAALRSNTMVDSIVSELLNNVANVESASGYENDTDVTDARGLPPHSVELVVEGGDKNDIASAILRRKAGGIQTHGSVCINVPGKYGDSIPIRFNRPEYLYTWLRVVLHGDEETIPVNYSQLVQSSVMDAVIQMVAGNNLLTQLLHEGIYDTVAGITYIDIYTAYSSSNSYIPAEDEYKLENVIVTQRQKVLLDATRIEVVLSADS